MLALVSCIAIACGTSSDAFVDELSTSEQVALCENFLDDFCALEPDFCADACIDTACVPAVENGDVDFECEAVLAGEVEDCGITADPAVCLQGGGCMIDALEAACSGS